MKLVYKIIAGSGLVVVPATAALGVYYGTKQKEALKTAPIAQSYGDHYFDNIIAAPGGEMAFAGAPRDGVSLEDILTINKFIDSKHAQGLVKSKKHVFKKVISFTNITSKDELVKVRQQLNKDVLAFKAGAEAVNSNVQLSKFISKDYISRTVTMTIYERKAPEADDQKLMDDFMNDLGGADFTQMLKDMASAPSWNPSAKPVFFEMFGSLNSVLDKNLREYFPLESRDETKFKALLEKWGLVSIDANGEEVPITSYMSGAANQSGNDYHITLDYNGTDKDGHPIPVADTTQPLTSHFPDGVVKLKKATNSPTRFFKKLLERGIIPTYLPIMDMKTGVYKLVVTFNKWNNHFDPNNLNNGFDELGNMPHMDMSLGEFPVNPDIQYSKTISMKLDGTGPSHVMLGDSTVIASGQDRNRALVTMKDMWQKKLLDYVSKPIVEPGLKLLSTYLPSLNNSLSDFIDSMKLMKNKEYRDALFGSKTTKMQTSRGEVTVNGDQFADELIKILEESKLVKAGEAIDFMAKFDLNWWSSIDNLTGLVPSDGGQYSLYQLVSFAALLSEHVISRVQQMFPLATVEDNNPLIPRLLKWLQTNHMLEIGDDLSTILANPVQWLGQALETMAANHTVMPLEMLQTLLPLVPVDLISAHAKPLAKAIFENLLKGGQNLSSVLNSLKLDGRTIQESVAEMASSPLNFLKKRLHQLEKPENAAAFDPEVVKIIFKTVADSELLPSFLNFMLPDTDASATMFSKFTHNGGAAKLLDFVMDSMKKGIVNMPDASFKEILVRLKDAFGPRAAAANITDANIASIKALLSHLLATPRTDIDNAVGMIATFAGLDSAGAANLSTALYKISNNGLSKLTKDEIKPITNIVKSFVSSLKDKDSDLFAGFVFHVINGWSSSAEIKADITGLFGDAIWGTEFDKINIGDLLGNLANPAPEFDTKPAISGSTAWGFITQDLWTALRTIVQHGISAPTADLKAALKEISGVGSILPFLGGVIPESAKPLLDGMITPLLDIISKHLDETTDSLDAITKHGLKDITTAQMQTIMNIVAIVTKNGAITTPERADAFRSILTNGIHMTGVQTTAFIDSISSSITSLNSSVKLIMKFVVGTDNIATEAANILAHHPAAGTLPAEVAQNEYKKPAHFYMTYAEIANVFEWSKGVLANPASQPDDIILAGYWLENAPKVAANYNAVVTENNLNGPSA